MTSDIIGTQAGIYEILYECDYKTKCDHKLYHVKCTECGWETDMTKSDAKRTSECRHQHMLTQEQLNIWYESNKKQCLHCGANIPLENLGFSEYKKRTFCNNSCAASYYNSITKTKNKQKHFCCNCGKELNRNGKYCSIKCQQEFQHKEYIQKWKDGEEDGMCGKYAVSKHIRSYLVDKHNNKCSKCGWGEVNLFTGNVPLEIHHKDGDYTNNDEDNLELLCPNCHSLTATYKAANIGNGRKDRKKYST